MKPVSGEAKINTRLARNAEASPNRVLFSHVFFDDGLGLDVPAAAAAATTAPLAGGALTSDGFLPVISTLSPFSS